MKQSTDHVLTTHTGSLPRPPDMLGLLVEEQQRRLEERSQLDDSVRAAVQSRVQPSGGDRAWTW